MEQTRTYGFIGAGNMGSALVSALVGKRGGSNVLVSDPDAQKLETLKAQKGIVPSDNETIAKTADFVVLAVKPQVLPAVLPPLKEAFAANEDFTIITMAAGTRHTVTAGEDGLQLIEVQIGEDISAADKHKYER